MPGLIAHFVRQAERIDICVFCFTIFFLFSVAGKATQSTVDLLSCLGCPALFDVYGLWRVVLLTRWSNWH